MIIRGNLTMVFRARRAGFSILKNYRASGIVLGEIKQRNALREQKWASAHAVFPSDSALTLGSP